MAERIETPPPKPDPKRALYARLERAPQEHAEALLSAYELLQLTHDKGLLEIAKGAVGSGEKVLWVLTKTMESDGATTLTRNLVILVKILGALNPAVLEDVEKTLRREVESANANRPPGLLRIFMQIRSVEGRRFLGSIAALVQSLGRNMHLANNVGRKRKKTMRHNA